MQGMFIIGTQILKKILQMHVPKYACRWCMNMVKYISRNKHSNSKRNNYMHMWSSKHVGDAWI